MKILHTSDWHLGRVFKNVSLTEDQSHLIDQVLEAAKIHEVDAIIVAGDIYDRTNPPEDAVKLWNSFFERLHRTTNAAFIAIAGNHDSPDRLFPGEHAYDPTRVLVRGPLRRDERVLVLEDVHGPVAFTALPYGERYKAREVFGDEEIGTPEDVLRAELDAARAAVPENARWVVVAHAFVANAKPTESERELPSVGGIETVCPSIFDGADYVALGHLHRPQSAGAPHIRYSGAPMGFGFDESGASKSMSLVVLNEIGGVNIEEIPFRPLRRLRRISGALAEIVAKAQLEPSDDFVEVELTDKGALVDPVSQLRTFYPNTLSVRRANAEQQVELAEGRATADLQSPGDVAREFVGYVRSEITETEENVLDELLDAVAVQRDEA